MRSPYNIQQPGQNKGLGTRLPNCPQHVWPPPDTRSAKKSNIRGPIMGVKRTRLNPLWSPQRDDQSPCWEGIATKNLEEIELNQSNKQKQNKVANRNRPFTSWTAPHLDESRPAWPQPNRSWEKTVLPRSRTRDIGILCICLCISIIYNIYIYIYIYSTKKNKTTKSWLLLS